MGIFGPRQARKDCKQGVAGDNMLGPAAMIDSCLKSSIAALFAPHTYTRLHAHVSSQHTRRHAVDMLDCLYATSAQVMPACYF